MLVLLGVLVTLVLVGEVFIMAQLDDIKAAQAETQAALGTIATELGEIASDLDALVTLVQAGSPDLTEVLNQAVAIRDAAKAQADAATAAAGKFTPSS